MFFRKSFSDARHFTASGARGVTMLLCHLTDESDGWGHLNADKALYLPNCPPGAIRLQMNSTKNISGSKLSCLLRAI